MSENQLQSLVHIHSLLSFTDLHNYKLQPLHSLLSFTDSHNYKLDQVCLKRKFNILPTSTTSTS